MIHYIKNTRWIVELNDLRNKCEYLLKQEYLKAIGGWQGDNMMRTRVETSQSYNVRQEQVMQEPAKRGFFSKKPKKQSPAVQGFSQVPNIGGK